MFNIFSKKERLEAKGYITEEIPNSKLFALCKYTGNETDISIPESIQIIKPSAFQYTDITSVYVPASVTQIGDNAFSDCHQLTKAETSYEKNIKIGKDVFKNCERLVNVRLSSSAGIPDGCFINSLLVF